MGAILVPDSIKLRGSAIGPSASVGDWWPLWRDWPWSTLLQPEIDHAVGQAGCNAVHILMSHQAVREGLISLATAQAQLAQFMAYCHGLGVWVLLRGEDPYHITHKTDTTTTSITNAAVFGFLNNMLSVATAYENFAGLDHVAESDGDWGSGALDAAGATRTNAIYSGVKGTYSAVPCSSSNTQPPGTNQHNWADSLTQDFLLFDAYEFNTWPSPIAYSDMAYFRTNYPNHDILFTEVGEAQSHPDNVTPYTTDQQDAFIGGVVNLCESGDSRFRGFFHFQVTDQDTLTSPNHSGNCLGLFDASWTPRQNKVNVIRRASGGCVLPRN